MVQQNWQDATPDCEPKALKNADSVLLRACLPVIFGVAATFALGSLFFPTLMPESLSWISLVPVAAFLLLIASFMSGIVAQITCQAKGNYLPEITASVALAACIGGLWVPAWVVSLQQPSVLTVLAGCFCIVSVGRSLKRYAPEATITAAAKAPLTGPIYVEDPEPLIRLIFPSLIVAVVAEAAITALFLKRYQAASVLAGCCAAALVWRFRSAASVTGEGQGGARGARAMLSPLMAFVFTVLVLMPYLRNFRWSGVGDFLMGRVAAMGRVIDRRPVPPSTRHEAYSGIILLPMTEPQKKIVAPPMKSSAGAGFRRMEPMVIPFDGAYWYFKAPDKGPRPTARIVRGSSTKATVRSTDLYPLLMEAHQKLGTRIDLSCCSSIEIALQNADRHPGAIALELWLVDSALPRVRGRYVGTVTIPSSEGEGGLREKPIEERLDFPVLPGGRGGEFDEITVVVRTDAMRARTGAQIAIRRFALKP